MAGTLRRLSTLPVLPDFGRRAHQFTVHEDDLTAAIVAVAQAIGSSTVPLGIANPNPVLFRTLMIDLAVGQGKPAPRFVPTPAMAVLGALRSAELLGVPLPVRADSLLGLVRPAPVVANLDVITDLGIYPRSFDGRSGSQPVANGGGHTGVDLRRGSDG